MFFSVCLFFISLSLSVSSLFFFYKTKQNEEYIFFFCLFSKLNGLLFIWQYYDYYYHLFYVIFLVTFTWVTEFSSQYARTLLRVMLTLERSQFFIRLSSGCSNRFNNGRYKYNPYISLFKVQRYRRVYINL